MNHMTNAEILRSLLGCDEWRLVEGDRRAIALNGDQILVQFQDGYAVITFDDPYAGNEVTVRMHGWSFGMLTALLGNIAIMTNIAKSHRSHAVVEGEAGFNS